MEKKTNKKGTKVKYPIGLKLILIFAALVVGVLGLSTFIVSELVGRDLKSKAQDTNLSLNNVTSSSVNSLIVSTQNNAIGFINDSLISQNEETLSQMFDDFCGRNPDVWFIQAPGLGLKVSPKAQFTKSDCSKTIPEWLKKNSAFEAKAEKGDVQILNFSSVMEQPSVCIIFPYVYNGKKTSASVGMDASNLLSVMTYQDMNTSFLFNKNLEVIVGQTSENEEENGFLEAAKKIISENDYDELMKTESDPYGENWICAYKKIAGGMYCVTCVSEDRVLDTVNRTILRITYISLAILFLAIMIIRFFSNSLTKPIIALVGTAAQIEKGNYNVKLKAKTQDEIGLLTKRFIKMGHGLAERERLKDSFSRFTNSSIAEKAMRGELTLGGENRNATIFFSDIRSFTAMSEKLTPHEVVEFLNEYMTKMVSCVVKTHGTVDKYIGDAIMAVWGAPETSGSAAADAWNAVNGALMMRYELYQLNKKRAAEGKAPIKIGCGINSGSVVAGQIGSDVRMEYTVIGDAVNLASRTEALNKPFQTDILITENTYNLIGDRLVVEEMPGVHVKGKENAIKMFAVINIKGQPGPKTLNQVRALMGYHDIDKSQVNTDEEEQKYKIDK